MGSKPKFMLRLLADAISDAVAVIEDRFEAAGLDFPSLHDPFDANHPSTALLFEQDVATNFAIIVGATEQLSVSVRPPAVVLLETIFAHHKSACLNIATATNVAEILREGGPQGVHVKDISRKNGVNAEKLGGHLFRRVAHQSSFYHIFTEVEPDVFCNNRTSSALDSLKPTAELFSRPSAEKYVEAAGISALIELQGNDHLKISAFMTEAILDSTMTDSDKPTETAFNVAFNTTDDYWTWLKRPGNEKRNIRFIMAMNDLNRLDNEQNVLQGFPWNSLPDGSKVVDVGGGIGSVSMTIAAACPRLNFIVQDRPHVISHAKSAWDKKLPGRFDSGRVIIQGHSFFDPQPVKDADLFFLRCIIHDWANSYSVEILRHLRNAAVMGKTRLLLIDKVVSYSCKDYTSAIGDIELPGELSIPEGLLPNLGRASSVNYLSDILMLSSFNGEERTIGTWNDITKQAGWEITRIWSPTPGSMLCHILAEPV